MADTTVMPGTSARERLARRAQELFAEARARPRVVGLMAEPIEECSALLLDEQLELLVMWGAFDQQEPLIAAFAVAQDPLTGDCGLVRSHITPFIRRDTLYALLPVALAPDDYFVRAATAYIFRQNGAPSAPLIERPPSFVVHMSASLDQSAVREGFRAALRACGVGSLACLCDELKRFPSDPWLRPSANGEVQRPSSATAKPGSWSDDDFDRWWVAARGDPDHFSEDVCATLDAWHGAITKAHGRAHVVVGVRAAEAFVRRFLAPCHERMLAMESELAAGRVN